MSTATSSSQIRLTSSVSKSLWRTSLGGDGRISFTPMTMNRTASNSLPPLLPGDRFAPRRAAAVGMVNGDGLSPGPFRGLPNLAARREWSAAVWTITERKQAEKRIRELGAIVERSDDAILGKTLDGIITSWNKGAEKIYDYAEKEVIGQPISILIPTDRQNELLRLLGRLARGESIELSRKWLLSSFLL